MGVKDRKNSTFNPEPDFFSVQVATAQRFYRNLNPDFEEDISVVAGGREQCAPGYEITRQTFPFYSIEFVAGGKGSLTLNDQKYALNPGTIFVYGPGIAHSIHSHQEDPLEKHFLNFVGRKAETLLLEYPLLGQVMHSSAPANILSTFEEITHYGLSHANYSDRICATLTELLVLKISETALTINDAGSPAFATYQKCRNEINNRYLELTSLTEIANVCHVDVAYICRLFKRFDQQSPYQYLLRLRMNYAAELMLIPGTLVKEVADKLGFEDQFHFSRTFKKVIGLSPVSFAKIHS